ncbi:MAG: hexitol phosphatase HxpB [Chitinophagaceae bacterium]|nr:hexitol phosphatase HxpB [Chitinophagaceae bacterium]
MQLNTVIFDMDGLLIDSEPYWQLAGMETLQKFDVALTPAQYHHTTGLRTPEWLDYWFGYFGIPKDDINEATEELHRNVFEKIRTQAKALPGIDYIFHLFKQKGFRIGLATSSPLDLVDIVTDKLNIGHYLDAIASAEHLPFGKPHPQVYMDCAAALGAHPLECLCFEDSFNGLVAAKAARMRCVVIPVADQYSLPKWGAADLKLHSLAEFRAEHSWLSTAKPREAQ